MRDLASRLSALLAGAAPGARRCAAYGPLIALGVFAAACGQDWTVFIPQSEPQQPPPLAEPQSADPHVCEPHPAPAPTQRCSSTGDPALPPCAEWVKVEPEGAVCSDGSPYKFFVNYASRSDNLLVMFEPGGACFDFDSCTRGTLGAANPHGVPDDHMAVLSSRLNLLRRDAENPAADWNMVFVSYCTGDVHGGDRIATYPDPAGGPALTYRHVGAHNTQAVIDFLTRQFRDVPQLLVTGCSAGGTGATQNYALIREAMQGVQCGYLLDDSGPIFSSAGPSHALHTASRAAWNLDPLLARLEDALQLAPSTLSDDFGSINTALAQHFPRDRFALVAYQRDLNYSLYSYAVFQPNITLPEIQADWESDLLDIKQRYESQPNMGYYMPYFRSDNCSHCATLAPIGHDLQTIQTQPWLGTDIAQDGLDLRDFIQGLLGGELPVARHFETDPTSDFTSEQAAMCLPKPAADGGS